MNWTLRIRAREEAIKRRWPERNDPDKLGERWVLRSHIIRLRYERIAERERWAPLDGSSE